MRVRITHLLLAGASLIASATSVSAQTAAEVAESDIVVTGSRVITGDNSPTPLTVISTQDLLTSTPSTISDAVNQLPVFSAPRGQVSNPNTGIGAGGGGNAVANQLNLRNLLSQRTLVLFDGHRMAPTTSTGIVDVDTVPQFLLKRVEVVTGGVSAVYGSDAIAGVVNFITDKDFNGIKASAQYGISDRGDGRAWSGGVAYGTKLGDRGHIEFSYEYRKDDGIDRRSSRPEFWRWTVQNNGSAAAPFFLTPDAVRTDLSFGGVIRSGLLNGQEFKTAGVLSPRTLGTATSSPTIRIGGDGAYFDGSLKAAQRSHQLFGRFDYALSDAIDFYVEGAANFKRNAFWGQGLTLANVTLSSRNAFLPAAIQSQLPAAGAGSTFTYGKIIDTAPRIRPVIDSTQVFLNAGLDGQFGEGWKWSLGYVHSTSKIDNTEFNNVNNLKLAAALDAVTSNGQVVCNVTITNPTAFPGCVPINVFGPGTESAAALSYILETTRFIAWTKQDDIYASITGSPFSTGAGDVKVALSGEWRHQGYRSFSNAETVAVGAAACAPLRFNCNPAVTQGWFQTFPNRTPISQSVTEAALEVNVPLVKDSSFAQNLDLIGAVRWTHYNTTGTYWTWKLGLDWQLVDGLRFRATKSRDIRAPTLDDLFGATSCFPANTTDLLTGLNSTAIDCTVANSKLTSEIGDTLTIGVVVKPTATPGFSMSLDYYNIKISDAITTVVGTNQTIQAGCYASGGASVYCALQDRALGNFTNTTSANQVTGWRRSPFNIAKVTTWGFDFEMNYATKLAGRPFSLRTLVTYQPHVRFFQAGLPVLDMGGIAFGQNGTQANPKWRLAAFVNFSPADNFSITLVERWRSKLGITADPTQFTTGPSTPSYATTNLNLAYTLPVAGAETQLFFNVQNLFNNIAPPANFAGSQNNIGLFGGFPIGDDPVGRFFTFGAKVKF